MDQKINSYLSHNTFVIATIILIALASFGLGRLSKIEERKPEIRLKNEATASKSIEIGESVGQYVASKNGSKYHLPWCSGASTIKEENKIWFNSKEEAEKAGYTPASNCKGI